MTELARRFRRCSRPRILVVGDCGVDRTVAVTDLKPSREALAPVWKVGPVQFAGTGMALAVANMASALGGDVLAVIGSDRISYKTRYLDREGRLLWRADHDADRIGFDDHTLQQAIDILENTDVVLVCDYDKGVCRGPSLEKLLDQARRRVPILVDPAPGRHWREYGGVTLVKPNLLEFEAFEKARAPETLDRTWDEIVVTRGGDGISYTDPDGNIHSWSARSSKVVDTCGCGDSVLAALGVCVGMHRHDACQIAAVVAGLKCERSGAAEVHRAEVLADLCGNVVDAAEVGDLAKAWRSQHKRIGFTNGVFDLFLHPGHAYLLQQAKAMVDILIVGVNSDASVRRLKGPTRPFVAESIRARQLLNLKFVDFVTIFPEDDPSKLLEAIRPDVLVKGDDWLGKELPGSEFAGKVSFIERIGDFSTTAIADRIAVQAR